MTEPYRPPSYRIADLPASDRPRERLAQLGPCVLKNEELLAILLRVGVEGENAVQVGQRLLHTYNNSLGDIHRAPFHELCEQHGISTAKAATIKAALELGIRMKNEKGGTPTVIGQPKDIADLVGLEMAGLEQEHLRVILLDIRNQVIDIVEVYKGSVNSSQVHVGELFKDAIRRSASGIIVVHNHPSGDPAPSPDDVALTRAMIQAGKLLDIEVLDHMIIGHGVDRWVSLKERGLGFG